MKIPKKLKVGGHQIKVKFCKADEENVSGCFKSWYDLIKINVDETSEPSRAETFLHEILEVIKNKNDLNLDHTVLTVLSNWLFAIIRDNNLDFREEKRE